MSRIKTLIEQTHFLLESQKIAQERCDVLFSDFLTSVKARLSQTSPQEEREILQKVIDNIDIHAQKTFASADDDINFLNDQLTALQEIDKIDDIEKQKYLLKSIIDDNDDLLETEEFKSTIQQEMKASEHELRKMLCDLEDAIKDGNADLGMLIEAIVEDNIDGQSPSKSTKNTTTQDNAEQNSVCCGSGGCSSEMCGSCPTGCGPEGNSEIDIFSFVSQYDQELANDQDSTQELS